MKKISHNKVNFIMLIIMIIWGAIILFIHAIPGLNSALYLADSVRYEIIGGYVDEYFIQINIIGRISYNIFYTLTSALIIIFSIVTIFKPNMIKAVGITLIVQNITLLSFDIWHKFLINASNNTILIDIKIYLSLTTLVAIIIILISLKQIIFYFILGIITLLQCLSTINLIEEYIGGINNIYVIFECFCGILTLILYWLILLSMNKKNNKPTAITCM